MWLLLLLLLLLFWASCYRVSKRLDDETRLAMPQPHSSRTALDVEFTRCFRRLETSALRLMRCIFSTMSI